MISITEYFSGNADITQPFIVQMHGAVALPVGRQIELRIYLLGGLGLFGTGSPKPQFDYPLIKDLETGIQYGDLFQFYADMGKAYNANQLFAAQENPLENLQEHSILTGKILACNVLSDIRTYDRIQTTLVIQAEI